MPRTKKILVAFLASSAVFALASPASAGRLSAAETSLLKTVNAVRASHGVAPVRIDYRLERTARAHSADMLRHQYFAHGAFGSRVRSSGAFGPVFGEDLAWGPVSASWVVSEWLASPEHRSVLLRPGFRRVGIGAYQGSFAGQGGKLVVTADFAGR